MITIQGVLKSLSLTALVFVLTACGSAQIKDPDQAERLLAAKYAIEAEYTLSVLVSNCKKMEASTRKHADQVQQQWWTDNWPLVDAADKEFQYFVKDEQLKHGAQTGQLLALRYMMELDLKARQNIYQLTKHEAYRDDRCIRALDKYLEEEMQLPEDKVKHAHLQFLRAYYGEKIADPHPVPVINSEYSARRDVGGKSLYKVEKIADKQLCDNFEILSLLEKGPKEVYGIFCENGKNHMIMCKWGQCEVVKE